MVAWEKQLEQRSVIEWRDKYVAYALLKRKLEALVRLAAQTNEFQTDPPISPDLPKRVSRWGEAFVVQGMLEGVDGTVHNVSNQALLMEADREGVEDFMNLVISELRRVSGWYEGTIATLESRCSFLEASCGASAGADGLRRAISGQDNPEEIAKMHLEAVRLTDFVMLNSEALRKIVKKLDKKLGCDFQGEFLKRHLARSALATPGKPEMLACDGERPRKCRRRLEALVSPERLVELDALALSATAAAGAGLARLTMKPRRVVVSVAIGGVALCLAPLAFPGEPQAQRCLALLLAIVSLWVSEAQPFEATALLVPPMAVALQILEGAPQDSAKKLLGAVFNESLYLVLCGFVISSIFSRCQLDSRAAAALQRALGHKPFLFMLAVMMLGVGLSALVSNVTAPLLLAEVLKPLLRDRPTDSRYSRALLLGLAFACNVGGMITPISSPQNVAAIQTLQAAGGNITWAQWLSVSVPFCIVAVLLAWALLMLVYRFDRSAAESERETLLSVADCQKAARIPEVVFEREVLSAEKILALIGATATLGAFAYAPAAELFGGTAGTAVLCVALALGTGQVSRQTFNAYSWHLLFLIGGGNALGLCVRESGLLKIFTVAARDHLSSDPWLLTAELIAVLVGATTFVSHTVAALVLMPLVVELASMADEVELAVLLGALACSAACALPMTSFPNVNSLMATDDFGEPWLSVKNFLVAGTPMTLLTAGLLVTFGYWLAWLAI